ncbi:putative bifunctional diguanylate cyclase/phosphodiesterase [Puerhibacterium sp. TATVAM-FAB25]|uniref:putative bifunctional diguanylate cyclase/phosphodiesterase n=1 Tax=Puerhibacterium sp. TATVAM-FAB25 TaxID=3093699 RepID=UPI00397B4EE8
MTHVHDVARQHDLALVAVAALLCLAGAWATSRFFRRMTEDGATQRYGWLFLTALASGVTIWATHFVAMLGFDVGVPVALETPLTAASLLVAVAGSAVGFLTGATGHRSSVRPVLGGVVVGLAVSAMHYVGMAAYRVDGVVSWDTPRVVLSVVLSVLLSTAALLVARRARRHGWDAMAALLALAVLALHLTGMSAMHVTPAGAEGELPAPGSRYVLAIAVAAVAFVIIGAGTAGYLIDARSRAASVERFRRLAMQDVLTGLPNRASFNERLEAEIGRAWERRGRLALVVLDVDNFKEINDQRGHGVGDEVLRALGGRFAALADHVDGAFVARVGGDEFVATVRVGGEGDLGSFLAELARTQSAPVRVGADVVPLRVSTGVAVFPTDAPDAENLVNNADLAMYRAKRDPVQDVCFYDAAVDERTRQRRSLATDLRGAVDRGELFLHYQPQTAVGTGEVDGYEALVRWRHPQLGPVSPGEFIPLAEENGLIVPIGAWVLRTACAEAATWDPPLRVAVNVSAVQLAHTDLVETVRQALEESGLPPERLELEVTETAVFTDRERARRALEDLRAMGVGLALDDFGVGYSSLDVLRSFPFGRIKIDRSFFSGEATVAQTVELIHAVLSLGRTFGMSVLAEGIETVDQLALLHDVGCEGAQGYLLGRPAPLEELVRSGRLRLAA